MSKKFLDALNKGISKNLDDKANGFLIFEKFGNTTEYISTGNYLLNAQLSGSLFGGLGNTDSIELMGASGTGKTFLCLNLVRDMIAKDYFVYYVDTEGAIKPGMFDNFGIDENSIMHVRTINTYPGLISFINTMINEFKKAKASSDYDGTKIALVVDSIGMLNTEASLENAAKGKYAEDMGKRAKQIRELFRTITLPLSNNAIPFIYTNHTAVNLDMFAIEKEVGVGGEGATYSADTILLLQTANYMKNEDKSRTGKILRSRPKKNRGVQPRDIEFHLSYVHGMNPYVGLEKYLSWDVCHVDLGSIMTPEEFNTKYKKGVAVNSKGEELKCEHWTDKDGEWYAVLNPTSKTLAVKSNHMNVNKADVFTDQIFTDEVLHEIDEKCIKPLFQYSKANDTARDIASMIEDATEENTI